MIYAVQGLRGTPIKIGYTKDAETLRSRVSTLQTAYPYPLGVLNIIDGTTKHEKALHAILDDFRLMGEWFEASAFVLHVIESFHWEDIAEVLSHVRRDWPAESDDETLVVSEASIPGIFQINGTIIPCARESGSAPLFFEKTVNNKRAPVQRYYVVSDLRRWLRENGIKYGVNWFTAQLAVKPIKEIRQNN